MYTISSWLKVKCVAECASLTVQGFEHLTFQEDSRSLTTELKLLQQGHHSLKIQTQSPGTKISNKLLQVAICKSSFTL